jgi:hypothetical protein
MVSYWRNQAKIDVACAIALSLIVWQLPKAGFPTLFVIEEQALITAARTWLGPVLTLLGMMSATTAFLFTVIDRGEFAALRKSSSEGQLWKIFAENLLWLAVAALFSAWVTFWNGNVSRLTFYFATFLLMIVAICIAKFVWIMRQIVSVRIAQAARRPSESHPD